MSDTEDTTALIARAIAEAHSYDGGKMLELVRQEIRADQVAAVNAPTIAEIVGRNVRLLRGSHTADELARAAQGLKWGTGRISELESGKVSPTISTLFVLTEALSTVLGRPVSLVELVATDDPIQVTDCRSVSADRISLFVSGFPCYPSPQVSEHSESDRRIAKSLGVTADQLGAQSIEHWGGSFTNERDRRAGSNASAQKRGRVSRQLKAEIISR